MPSAPLRTIPLSSARLSDRFWAPWQRQMAQVGIPHQWRQTEETGRLENFRRVARKEAGGFQGLRFNDSDVYKLLEASCYAMALGVGEAFEGEVGEAIDLIAAAQRPDGYINTFVQLDHSTMRWRSLNALHEMYCIGHLIEAAVAHHDATHRTRLLDAAQKAAACVMREFGPGKRVGYPDHQEMELALVRLSRTTGDARHLDYARWQIQSRGSRPSPFEPELQDPEVVALTPGVRPLYIKDGAYDGAYAQDDVPLVRQTRAVGHAVRAMYNYCGAVDCLGEDAATMAALCTIWDSLTSRQMYVTGGIGSSGRNEGFTEDYDLPNMDAYAETCAGIGLVFWAWRMFLWSHNGKYLDVMDRALYNAVLSGVSLSCDRYFYDNPLESDGRHERAPWFSCACCPPNIARLLMSIGQYFVAVGDGEAYVAQPVTGVYECGHGTLGIEGDYPWNGDYQVRISKPAGLKRLSVRVPGWSRRTEARINGESVRATEKGGFLALDRDWKDGDTVEVACEMGSEFVAAHKKVLACAGRTAVQRGPIVFCCEEHDLGAAPQHFVVEESVAPLEVAGSGDRSEVALEVQGCLETVAGDPLYGRSSRTVVRAHTARLVPYFTWANRGPNAMAVWLRRR